MFRFFNCFAGIFHRLCWCMSWMHNWLCGSESIFPPYMNLMIKHPCIALYALLCAFKKDLYKTNSTLNIRAMKFSAAGLLGHSGRVLIITYFTFKSHLGSCMDIWKLVKYLYFSLLCHVYVSCDACRIYSTHVCLTPPLLRSCMQVCLWVCLPPLWWRSERRVGSSLSFMICHTFASFDFSAFFSLYLAVSKEFLPVEKLLWILSFALNPNPTRPPIKSLSIWF